jgi:ferric-chelate reductase (NADPH)
MATARKVLSDVIGKLFFRQLSITHTRELSPRFRRLTLTGEALEGASFGAGDKLQVMLEDGPRTYTPFAFDAARGSLDVLVYVHAQSPGSRWGQQAALGERVQVFGPRGSLRLSSLAGPVVLFGDETSLGVARALGEHAGFHALSSVFEVANRAEAAVALADLGLPTDGLVERDHGEQHLGEVAERLHASLSRHPKSSLVLTGKAQSIQALRKQLKRAGAAPQELLSKAYWAPGKRGLD